MLQYLKRSHFIQRLARVDIRVYATLFSLALTLIRLSYRQPVNPDAIIYFASAKAYLAGGFHAAIGIFDWPFYSILIATLSHVFGGSLYISMRVLNAGLDAGTAVVFVSLARHLDKRLLTAWCALLLLLFFPFFVHYFRIEVIRGHGYLAFSLLGMLGMLRYIKQPRWYYGFWWASALAIATLFRVEGVLLLLLTPIGLLFTKNKIVVKHGGYFFGGLLLAIILICASVAIFFYPLIDLTRITFLLNQQLAYRPPFFGRAMELGQSLSPQLSPLLSASDAAWIFWLGATSYIFYFVFMQSPLINVLVIYSFIKRAIIHDRAFTITWVSFVIINLLICLVFMWNNFFINVRYIALLWLMVLLVFSVVCSNLYGWFVDKRLHWFKRRLIPILVMLLLVSWIAGGLTFIGPSNTFIINAAEWINQETPSSAKIAVNSNAIPFYIDREVILITPLPYSFTSALDALEPLDRFDYLVFLINRHYPDRLAKLSKTLGTHPVKIFYNNRRDMIVIYKLDS